MKRRGQLGPLATEAESEGRCTEEERGAGLRDGAGEGDVVEVDVVGEVCVGEDEGDGFSDSKGGDGEAGQIDIMRTETGVSEGLGDVSGADRSRSDG